MLVSNGRSQTTSVRECHAEGPAFSVLLLDNSGIFANSKGLLGGNRPFPASIVNTLVAIARLPVDFRRVSGKSEIRFARPCQSV